MPGSAKASIYMQDAHFCAFCTVTDFIALVGTHWNVLNCTTQEIPLLIRTYLPSPLLSVSGLACTPDSRSLGHGCSCGCPKAQFDVGQLLMAACTKYLLQSGSHTLILTGMGTIHQVLGSLYKNVSTPTAFLQLPSGGGGGFRYVK